MKERGLIFSAPMVRALLAGTKTQTRRLIKPQPWFDPLWGTARGGMGGWIYGSLNERRGSMTYGDSGDRWHVPFDEEHQRRACTEEAYGWGARAGCPYGVPGDRLWVRETWRAPHRHDALAPSEMWPARRIITYEAGGARGENYGKTRVSIHMPRWASRITLEVTEVRVQRLQDISEEDARAEGLTCLSKDDGRTWKWGIPDRDGWPGTDDDGWEWQDWCLSARAAYARLWDQIKGAGSWASNPWVWCVSFPRIEAAR